MKPASFHALASAAVIMAALGACATNPATGERQLSLIGEQQEIQLGKEADQEIGPSMGLYSDQRVQAYVAGVGARLAADSERPNLPWTFRVVDDSTVNAFALPGGFIYMTRGILAHMNSEAEMASVLGHEIGHVTARHSVSQMSKAQLASLGLGVGMILSPELRNYGDLAQVGLGLLFLKYGRDDERQADSLGLRYLTREGYAPRPMVEMFQTLDRISQAQGSGRIPNWLSTHPNPGDRAERIQQEIQKLPEAQVGDTVRRDPYLTQLDGMTFGEDPREGFFQQNVFFHPEMRFRFDFPSGWKTSNTKQAVGAVSPNQDAVIAITLARRDSPEQAAREFFAQQGLQAGQTLRGDVNGLPVIAREFAAATQSGDLRGVAAFVGYGNRVFQVLGYSVAGRWGQYSRTVSQALNSFDRLTDRRYLDVSPRRIELQRLPRDMTLREFAERYPSTVPLATLALVNHVQEGDRLESGRTMKRVLGGELP